MKIVLAKLLSFAIISCLPNLLQAGAISGGGGRSIVCRNDVGIIQRAEILDLYEAQKVFNLTLDPELGDYHFHLERMLKKIPNGILSNLDLEVIQRTFTEKIQFIDGTDQLEPVNDSFEPVTPKNCKIEQIVNYHQSGRILIAREIWDFLSPRSKTALTLHEIVYNQSRIAGNPKSSYYVRRFVGLVFSTETVQPPQVLKGFDTAYRCINTDSNLGINRTYEFVVAGNACADNPSYYCNAKIKFEYLDGQMTLDRTEAEHVADQILRALNPNVNLMTFSGSSPIQSSIFEGANFLYTVLQHGAERRPRVALSTNGNKEFVDLVCSQITLGKNVLDLEHQ